VEGRPPAREPQGTPWSLIIFGVLAVYIILVSLLNSGQVKVHFVFFTTEISLLVLILLCLGIGFAAGYLLSRLRERRQRAESAE
jgi:uncharacterized integral membrane protein